MDKAQMEKLEREHAAGLAFADELLKVAREGTDEEVARAVDSVHRYNLDELEAHLQHEEQTILGPLMRFHPEHSDLCITIGREHGVIRTLVEEMTLASARHDLVELGRVLKSHTLMEDRNLFPLVDSLFTPDQLAAIENFTPFRRHESLQSQPPAGAEAKQPEADDLWLSNVEQHLANTGPGGNLVLLSRYDPDKITTMAGRLGFRLFDYQKEVMEGFGKDADLLGLDQLNATLRAEAEKGPVVTHNVEALLCVKPEQERRGWLSAFLDTDLPHPLVLPITVFHLDVPKGHQRVCDADAFHRP